jgi:hypothetical protein
LPDQPMTGQSKVLDLKGFDLRSGVASMPLQA